MIKGDMICLCFKVVSTVILWANRCVRLDINTSLKVWYMTQDIQVLFENCFY